VEGGRKNVGRTGGVREKGRKRKTCGGRGEGLGVKLSLWERMGKP